MVKEGVSAHVISQTTSLSIDEYDNDEKKISIPYKVGQRIKEWRLRRGYTQEDLASKVGIINQRIYEYEQGRAGVSLEMLDEIAKVLLISITDLLPETTENENSEVELSRLIEEYKKIKSQELRNVLIKSLFESIQDFTLPLNRVKRLNSIFGIISRIYKVSLNSQPNL